MSTREKKFFVPVLRSYNDDTRKRWRVEYTIPANNRRGCKRVTVYGNINAVDSIHERHARATALINDLRFDLVKETPDSLFTQVLKAGRLEWRAKTLSTYQVVATKLETYLIAHRITKVTTETIGDFLRHSQDSGTNTSTLHKYRSTLYSLFERAIKMGLYTVNPVKQAPKPKKIPQSLYYFSSDQMTAIKNECEGSQLWLAVRLLFYCFIRPGEQRALKIGDINFEMGFIEVRGEISKNGKTEKVSIPDHFLEEIMYLKDYPNGHYVLSKSGKPGAVQVSTKYLNDTHRDILDKLKIRGHYAFYSWKHTGVVRCVQAGLNIRDIQNQLRHHSLDMVQVYLRNLGVLQSVDLKTRYPKL